MSMAMVVLSGGQDSTTCLFWAKQHYDRVLAVTFDYGQRHDVEIMAARTIAQLAGVEHEVVHVPSILRGRSPLTNPAVKLERYADYESMTEQVGDRIESTFVPMRNAFFLVLAANLAVTRDCYTLVTGVCEQDSANYPDCRLEFIRQLEKATNLALGSEAFEIQTPLIHLTKAESIHMAQEMPGCMWALAWSHTCYAGEVPPCGTCHSCLLRASGFKQAGIDDPLVVRTKPKAKWV